MESLASFSNEGRIEVTRRRSTTPASRGITGTAKALPVASEKSASIWSLFPIGPSVVW